MRFLFLDFEFFGVNSPKLEVVSLAASGYVDGVKIFTDSVWTLDDVTARRDARDFLKARMSEGYIFVAYVAEAEARAMFDIGSDARLGQWVDLYVEYRRLLNHNHGLSYGEQYLEGEIVYTTPPPPKWERVEKENPEDEDAHHKPSYSLAAATFKLLKEKIDTEEKDFCRKVIISGDRNAINKERERILKYNESDIAYLPRLLKAMVAWDFKLKNGDAKPPRDYIKEWLPGAIKRGKYGVWSAAMIKRGYPVNTEKIKNFTSNISEILSSAAESCNAEAEGFKPFSYVKKLGRYKTNEKEIREWVKGQGIGNWRVTDKGKLSLSKDAFSDFFNSNSEGFAGAYYRYLKTKQSLNGFMPIPEKSKRKSFFEFLGSDGRVRPYFGIYGSQSSRSQPSATSFIPLKSHWMRNFIEPKPGFALAGIDYASQEFLISAILSQDEDMIDAYKSGDVYLAFGKAAGFIPPDGTKKSHPLMREAAKATVLGISYDMTEFGLAPRLSQVLSKKVEPDEAAEYITLFYETYPDFSEWKRQIQNQYDEDGFLELPDGWAMWGDNDNRRSVGNFPVQGHGAVIMREAVERAEAKGCRVIFTLHDALYIEYPSFEFQHVKNLCDAMSESFKSTLEYAGDLQADIRLEGETWSPDYTEKTATGVKNVVAMPEYMDDKGSRDLKLYRKYFTSQYSQRGGNYGIQKSGRAEEVFQVQ